jgi:hypothetical protein
MINVHCKLLSKVDESEMWLLLHLVKRVNVDQSSFPSNKTLLKDTGWKIDKLQKVKKNLIDRELLIIQERPNTSNLYVLNTDLLGIYVNGKGQKFDIDPPLGKIGIPIDSPEKTEVVDVGKTNNEVLSNEVLILSTTVDNNIYASSVNFEEIKKPENTVNLGGMPLEARLAIFQEDVYKSGKLIYTKQMLDDFIATWSQHDNAKKPKMRWEKERTKKGWVLKLRLNTWATNNFNKIECYLTESQKTISQKKDEFKALLQPYLPRYGKDYLNYFFQVWATPENIPDPKHLKWEKEEFWDLANKLAQWHTTWLAKTKQPQQFQRYGN